MEEVSRKILEILLYLCIAIVGISIIGAVSMAAFGILRIAVAGLRDWLPEVWLNVSIFLFFLTITVLFLVYGILFLLQDYPWTAALAFVASLLGFVFTLLLPSAFSTPKPREKKTPEKGV